jgi:hypothetical protein
MLSLFRCCRFPQLTAAAEGIHNPLFLAESRRRQKTMNVEDFVVLPAAAQWLARLTHRAEELSKLFPD